ncbi:MAG: class I SAM-dependent methyltransferase [Gammaproteobacteria bacterium]|nr:class I SAM-dependent methyltransferase [Gammaproteobacteria bacterium]
MTQRKPIHDRVLNASGKEELAAAYGEWADHFDHDLLDELGYVAPALASERFSKHVTDETARILDAGCGTGLVGERLEDAGYRHVVGLDFSEAMLDKARDKEVYEALHRADLTARLEFPDDSFDAVISVGTFTCGHVGPEALDELIRVTRPGGCICFTVREQAWHEEDYRSRLDALRERGLWQRVEERTMPYIEDEGADCRLCIYRVNA